MFLDEILRLEGLGAPDENGALTCVRCSQHINLSTTSPFRCRDCTFPGLWHRECLVEAHRVDYVHRIQVR